MVSLCYTIRMKANPKLSNTSKMPGKSWSLNAWETCPGARDDNGEPVDACSTCYALTGAYQFPVVIAARDHNLKDWQNEDWVDAMVKLVSKQKWFRWFDSGDIYTPGLANKMYHVMLATPNTKHWLPTRSYKVPAIYVWTQLMTCLDNVAVRYSSDSKNGERLDFGNNSTIVQYKDEFIPEKGVSLCRASERDGACGSCRACWSDRVDTIVYPFHGKAVAPKKFQKVLAV